MDDGDSNVFNNFHRVCQANKGYCRTFLTIKLKNSYSFNAWPGYGPINA